MADSRVEVTSGIGTSIDTRTESTNGHHRQVVVVGDPTNNAGVAPVDATNGLAVDVTRLPYAGQQSMSSSIPVAIASNQSDLPVVNTDTLGEDTVYTTGDPTRLAGYIAKSTPTQLVTGDGRYSVPQTTLKGEVYVKQTDAVPVTDNSGSITVDGTVSVTGVATATKQSDGSQKTQIVDGSGNVIGATSNALDINIKSGNPTSITANAGTNLNTSALALETGGNLATIAGAIKNEDVASTGADPGLVVNAMRQDTPANTSGTDGDYEPLRVSAGRLWASTKIDTALPAGTNAIGKLAANSGVDIGDVDVTSVSGNVTVVQATASNLNVTEASASAIKTSVELIDDSIATTGSAITSKGMAAAGTDGTNARILKTDSSGELQVDVLTLPALSAGTAAIGKLAANDGVDIGDVTINNSTGGSAVNIQDGGNSITVDGTVTVSNTAFPINASASVTGLSVSKTDAQTATVTAVKASAGRVYGYHIYNSNSADAFLQFYDIASGSVTVGTSARTLSLWVPAGGALDGLFTIPITFGTAISIAATTTITGSSAPSTGLLVDIFYI